MQSIRECFAAPCRASPPHRVSCFMIPRPWPQFAARPGRRGSTVGAAAPWGRRSPLSTGSANRPVHPTSEKTPVVLEFWATWCPPVQGRLEFRALGRSSEVRQGRVTFVFGGRSRQPEAAARQKAYAVGAAHGMG